MSDEELLRRAVAYAYPRHSRGYVCRWVAVRDMFNVGSTTACELCRRFGYDPHEETRKGRPRKSKT